MLKTVTRPVAALFALVAIVYLVLSLTARPVSVHPFFNRQVLAMAHRGGRGLWPENTMFAFQKSADMGVDVLEMDIHSTADGVLVTMHDETVDRTTDGSGPIHGLALAELQALDAGYNWTDDEGATYPYKGQGIIVPTLEEILTAFPDTLLNIEIKQVEPPIVAPFCQMLRDFGRQDQVLVGSFDASTVEAFRRECPEVATSTTEPEVRTFFVLNTVFLSAVYRGPAEALQVPEFRDNLHVVTSRFVRNAHRHNMEVHVWTVNEVGDMERLLELGVDGLITDYPDRLMRLLGR